MRCSQACWQRCGPRLVLYTPDEKVRLLPDAVGGFNQAVELMISFPAIAGSEALRYQITRELSESYSQDTFCISAGASLKSDCMKAIAQLQAKGNTPCLVPTSDDTTSTIDHDLNSAYYGPVAIVAPCRVILGSAYGSSLPCSQVAGNATNLVNVCGTSHQVTGGYLYPTVDTGNETIIAVSNLMS